MLSSHFLWGTLYFEKAIVTSLFPLGGRGFVAESLYKACSLQISSLLKESQNKKQKTKNKQKTKTKTFSIEAKLSIDPKKPKLTKTVSLLLRSTP